MRGAEGTRGGTKEYRDDSDEWLEGGEDADVLQELDDKIDSIEMDETIDSTIHYYASSRADEEDDIDEDMGGVVVAPTDEEIAAALEGEIMNQVPAPHNLPCFFRGQI